MSKTNETPEETYVQKAWAAFPEMRYGRGEETTEETI